MTDDGIPGPRGALLVSTLGDIETVLPPSSESASRSDHSRGAGGPRRGAGGARRDLSNVSVMKGATNDPLGATNSRANSDICSPSLFTIMCGGPNVFALSVEYASSRAGILPG